MKSVTKRRLRRGRRRTIKRGGAKETKVYPDGTYVGSIDNNGNRQSTGQFDGGKMTYNNGDVFEGFWNKDKATGLGVMTYANGDHYRGSWVDGKRQGEGTMIYKNDEYHGDWVDDMRQGEGLMYYSDDSRYKGDWFQDKIQGEGAMMYPDGSTYIGNWDDGKRHGQGVLYGQNREVAYRGNWVNDEPRPIDVNQIHKFTANINFDELNAFLQLHSKKEVPYIYQPTPDAFGDYIKDSMRKIIQSTDTAKIEERLKNFDFLMENTLDKIKYSVYSDDLKTGVFLSLKYAQLQPQAFKEAYVESYLDDTCKAHGDDISVENLSCPTGTFERFVTSLAPAATAVLSTGQANEEQKQEYEKLAEMITRNLETLIPNLIREWQRSHRNGVGLESIVGDEQRRANLKAYIEETVTNDTPEINELIEKLIKEHADSVGYDNEELQLGGRTRKRRPRKGKKTKKRKGRK